MATWLDDFNKAMEQLKRSGQPSAPLPVLQMPEYQAPQLPSYKAGQNFTPTNFSFPAVGGGGMSPSLKGDLTTVRKNQGMESSFWDAPLDNTLSALGSFFGKVDANPVGHAVLGTLQAPQQILFNQVKSWADGDLNSKDFGLGALDGLFNAYSRDESKKTYIGDVFGELADRADSLGVNPFGFSGDAMRKSAHDGKLDGGDVLDFIFDPVNYMTLGAGNMAKAVGAGTKLGKESALAKGLLEGTPDFQKVVDDAVNASVAKNNNNLLGFDVPFTDKQFSLLQKFGPLRRESDVIGSAPALNLTEQLKELGQIGDSGNDITRKLFGKDITQLNTQEFNYLENALKGDLGSQLKNFKGDDPFTSGGVPQFNGQVPSLSEFLRGSKFPTQFNEAVTIPDKQLPSLADMLGATTKSAPDTFQTVNPAERLLQQVYDIAKERGLPAGREYEYLRDSVWPSIAPRTGMSFDQLIEMASKQPSGVGSVVDKLNASKPFGVFPDNLPANVKPRTNLKPNTATLGNVAADVADTPNIAGMAAYTKIDDVLKGAGQLDNTATAPNLADLAAKVNMDDALKSAKDGYTYHSGLDGTSAMGRTLGQNKLIENLGGLFGTRRHVPVASQLADHRIKDGVGAAVDAKNSEYSMAWQAVKNLEEAIKPVKGDYKKLTQDERNMIPFLLEGTGIPAHLPQPSPERLQMMQRVADSLRKYTDDMTGKEKAAGVNYTERANYFPHYMNVPKDNADWTRKLETLTQKNPDLARRLTGWGEAGYMKERTAFQTMRELSEAMNANPDLADLFKNASFDPVEALARRAATGARDIARVQLTKHLEDAGLVKEGKNVPAGWVKIDKELGSHLQGKSVPKEVYNEMTHIDKIVSSMPRLNKVAETTEKAFTIYKRNLTVVKLDHHIRNFAGNIVQNSLAGVTPPAYAAAFKALKNPDKHASLITEAIKNGIIHTGQHTADMVADMNAGVKQAGKSVGSKVLGWINPISENYIVGTAGRKTAEKVDNASRMAHYIWARGKGMTEKQAMDSVRKYLYTYAEMTALDRRARILFPFWMWTRNNVPFQVMQAVKRPGLTANLQQVMDNLVSEPDHQEVFDQIGLGESDRPMVENLLKRENGGSVMPEFLRSGKYAQFGDGQYYNHGLPQADLRMLNPTKTAGEAMGMFNSLFKLPVELAVNTKSFNGAPIDKYAPKGEPGGADANLIYAIQQLLGGPGQLLTGESLQKSLGLLNTVEGKPQIEVESQIRKEADRIKAQKRKARDQQSK